MTERIRGAAIIFVAEHIGEGVYDLVGTLFKPEERHFLYGSTPRERLAIMKYNRDEAYAAFPKRWAPA